jgi:hypothetical protein
MAGIPIGYYAILERRVMGLLKIKEMQEALTFFEDAYKSTQGKRYNGIRFEVEHLRESLGYEEEEQMEALEKLVKPKNLSFFKH